MNGSQKIVAWVLIALAAWGVALGPGYLIGCWFFSGSVAGEYPLTVGLPLVLELAPDMNPIRLNAVIEYSERPTSIDHRTDYRATLKEGNRELWTSTFGVTQSSDTDEEEGNGTGFGITWKSTVTSRSSIRMFSVDTPGHYVFLVTPGRESDVAVQKITLKVRRNVTGANVPVAMTGFLLLGVGIVGLIIMAFKRRRSGNRRKRPGK